MQTVYGTGSVERALSADEVRQICASTMGDLSLDGRRVLVLIPDYTRHAPIDLFFSILTDLLSRRVKTMDFLVATGTHPPMSIERIYHLVGITEADHRNRFRNIAFFNHEHANPDALAALGTLSAEEVSELTNGLFKQELPVSINRKAVEYDHIIIVSPVVPHEAMGFAGGNKYFFPGIGGLDVIETFHWLAAVITNPVVNGMKDTPTRRVIDRAVEFLPTPRTCLAFAINDRHEIACLFGGEPKASWSKAADYSAQLHITYKEKTYTRILGITPPIYDDLWVAGKAMYKLEPVAAEGGELIIYGPHIKDISFTHGSAIRRIGYHVRDYFTGQWDRFAAEPKLILAHSTNVKGIGSFSNGVEKPRIRVTLATSIPAEVCKQVNLGYRDPRTINLDEWRKDTDDDLLVVKEAGQVLHRLRK
jgi:nickel-dependent lactate racemase